jgi:hypothetical protein
VRYVDLYLRLRAGKLPSNEAKEVEALEEELEFHEIVFFRCSAIRQMQKHQVLSLLCFTSTKVQLLRLTRLPGRGRAP